MGVHAPHSSGTCHSGWRRPLQRPAERLSRTKPLPTTLEHARQSLARFEAIDVTGFPEQETTELRAHASQSAGRTRQRAIQRLGNAGDAIRRHSPGIRRTRLRFTLPQRERLRRLSLPPAPDPARARSQPWDTCATDCATTACRPEYLLEKVSEQAQDIADDSLDKSPFTNPLRKFPDFRLRGGPEATARSRSKAR